MIRVGQKLKDERIRKGLTLEEIAKTTKIRASFLSAIEKGEYKKLPSGAYTHGFVKNYAEYLGLPNREILAMFRREFDEKEYVRVLPEGLAGREGWSFSWLKLSHASLLVILVLLALLGYIVFQYRYLVFNPPLEVVSPKEGEIVGQSLMVVGRTDPNATVFVNDRITSVERNGTFTKAIFLFPGKGVVKVSVQNRAGNKTQIERNVEVKSSEEENQKAK